MWPRRLQQLGDPDLVLRAAIAGVFAVMLASWLAHTLLGLDFIAQVYLFPLCPFRAATGVPCPGCGMTRAFLLLSQLRLGEAMAVNPLAPFLAAAMAWRLARPKQVSHVHPLENRSGVGSAGLDRMRSLGVRKPPWLAPAGLASGADIVRMRWRSK